MRLNLEIRNICRWCSVGVVAFIMVCGWDIVLINSHPIETTYHFITKNHPINILRTPSSHQNSVQSNHSTQSSSTKTTITNQPSTTHFIKYENVIYKLTLSTDGKQQRWIYVTPLNNHYHQNNSTKGNDVSGHTRRPTGNKRTVDIRAVMKVSNATIPITLSTVHNTDNLYKNFNNYKVNSINNGDDETTDGHTKLTKLLKIQRNVESGNGKLDVENLSNIEQLRRATVVQNIKQSNNIVTNEANDEFNNIDEYRENVEKEKLFNLPFQNVENERSFYRNGFNPFGKKMFANDGVVNKERLPPLIKNDFVKSVLPGNGLSAYQRYAIQPVTTQSSAVLPFRHLQLNEFSRNDYYRLMEERNRKYSLKSNPFHRGNQVNGGYRIWNSRHQSFDPVVMQLMFTHHESILPQPHFWGYRGYGLYSFAAGNDLHNNLPNGGYKVERDFDN